MAKNKIKRPPLLTVIIPVYNEARTIGDVIKRIRTCGVKPLEVIVVNDGSTDQTDRRVRELQRHVARYLVKKNNEGKGAAIRDGLAVATGKYVLIQDADDEYSPSDYVELLAPALEHQAQVVYGSRFISSKPRRVVYFWHFVGNIILTTLCNVVTNLNLSDMETGYKVFSRNLLQKIVITENGFGVEPELTIKLAALNAVFYEVGISYHGRTYAEGKKITYRDFFQALKIIGWLGLKKLILGKQSLLYS